MGSPNWSDKTVWTGDNLPIMRGMNSESVDLIYLDPPFNSKRDYAAPVGSAAAGAEFRDTWTLADVDVEWINLIEAKHPALYRVLLAAMTDSDKSYLVYMAARLLEMRRLLKPTGSIWLHCDPTMSHYLKLAMDAIFGRWQCRNEVIWQRSTASGGKAGGRTFVPGHDVLLYFTAGPTFTHHRQYMAYTAAYVAQRFKHTDESGRRYRLQLKNRRQYLDESKGKPVSDIWTDTHPINPMAKEKTGYPTQKPLALLERIIRACSDGGGMVLDPFCGCATTMVAADGLGRSWAGIDISPKAVELVTRRIKQHQGLFRKIVHREDIPRRTDLGALPRYNCLPNRKALYGEQAGNCGGCRTHFEMRHLEVDHVIARSVGGTDHLANLQLLCGNCNRIKGDRGMEYLRTKLQLT